MFTLDLCGVVKTIIIDCEQCNEQINKNPTTQPHARLIYLNC